MKNNSSGFALSRKSRWLNTLQALNYKNIPSGLTDEMIGFIRPSEPGKCCPPFKMVIIDKRGTVVFECKVSNDRRVRPLGMVRKVGNAHVTAAALLTERAL